MDIAYCEVDLVDDHWAYGGTSVVCQTVERSKLGQVSSYSRPEVMSGAFGTEVVPSVELAGLVVVLEVVVGRNLSEESFAADGEASDVLAAASDAAVAAAAEDDDVAGRNMKVSGFDEKPAATNGLIGAGSEGPGSSDAGIHYEGNLYEEK